MPAPQPVGSRRLQPNGYVRVKMYPGQRRWAFEHRVVWEQAHGPIPDGAFIHHRNGVKSDNRLENLHLVLSNREHHREHHADIGQRVGRAVGLWNSGRPKSPEHRAKIAAANRGKPKSPEHRAKLAAALVGKPLTPEHRAKIAAANRGKPKSPEHRAKIAAALVGKPLTPEHRARIADAQRGRPAPWAKASPRDPDTGRFLPRP